MTNDKWPISETQFWKNHTFIRRSVIHLPSMISFWVAKQNTIIDNPAVHMSMWYHNENKACEYASMTVICLNKTSRGFEHNWLSRVVKQSSLCRQCGIGIYSYLEWVVHCAWEPYVWLRVMEFNIAITCIYCGDWLLNVNSHISLS